MKKSAGILLYRTNDKGHEFFLVHPGGPFFIKKHAGWWTIPKGETEGHEDPLATAIREFEEETAYRPKGDFLRLSPVRQKGGKEVSCWAVAGDLDPATISSNTFELEWPPRSGKRKLFPEIDQGGWFSYADAITLINEKQKAFIEELIALLDS